MAVFNISTHELFNSTFSSLGGHWSGSSHLLPIMLHSRGPCIAMGFIQRLFCQCSFCQCCKRIPVSKEVINSLYSRSYL